MSSSKKMKLEVCVDSFESAKAAVEGGADQLEVCSSLSLGGLTPTIGLVKQIKSVFPSIPQMIMLRSRKGDFMYDEQEMSTLELDLEELKPYASGFVFGFLNGKNRLCSSHCSRLLSLAAPLPCTLHRAFDLSSNWKEDLDEAITLGFKTILTSGQRLTAIEGISSLLEIMEYAAGRIDILIGSGVNEKTIAELVRKTKANNFHGSGAVPIPSRAPAAPFPMGSADSNEKRVTDKDVVEKMVQILNGQLP